MTMTTTASVTATVTSTEPAPTSTARRTVPPSVGQPSTVLGGIAAVSPSGRLRLPDLPSTGSGLAMNRRTRTGSIYRIDLGGGISCWLDGDQHDGSGELNWVATQMCFTLSGGTFTGPDDAPFVCGLVLFTGTPGTGGAHVSGPVALSEQQVRRIVDAHAATTDELGDPAGTDLVPADAAWPHLALA